MAIDVEKNTKKYTQTVGVPIFEPDKRRNLQINDTVNIDKYVELTNEIMEEYNKGNITLEERKYLILAAARWVQWNYADVAQYYATNASDNVKRLLERSAMVLIDSENAFANGIITAKKFYKKITEAYIEDNPDRKPSYAEDEDIVDMDCGISSFLVNDNE